MSETEEIARVKARARERFLEGGSEDPRVREPILNSWRRSKFWGVESDRLDLPYQTAIDTESRLMHAARPVLERLERMLGDSRVVVILTDANGWVLERRAGDTALHRHLDSISLAPGFSYAERFVGTNGIGTALEDRGPAHVFGSEHFSERLQSMSCAGAPIRNPVSRRLEGVIDITCRESDASPLMPALALDAASLIEQRLLEQSSANELALLQEFLSACRTATKPIVSVNSELIIANAQAARLLGPGDHQILWEKAAESIGGRRPLPGEVCLSQGRLVRLHCHRIEGDSGTAGAIVEISTADAPRPAVRPSRTGADPGLAGRSAAWLGACHQVEDCCRDGTWVLLRGEPGVGKLAITRAVHRRLRPAARLYVIDMTESGEDFRGWREHLEAALATPGATVVLRHLNRLDTASTAITTDLLSKIRTGDRWVVGTVATDATTDLPLDRVLPYFGASVTVPPLRHRIDDVRELVPVFLRKHAPRRHLTCPPDVMQTLMRLTWPGNAAQLEGVIHEVATRRPAGQIELTDLPAECHSTSRRVLTPMESLERDAITRALIDAGGDKSQAAVRLGISRATVYRKIRTFGIAIDR